MKKVLPLIAGCLLSSFAWGAQAFHIEPAWSKIEFGVKNFGLHTVYGQFKVYGGTVTYDDADVTGSAVSVYFLTSSIDTGIKKRDAHLRTAEFFDAQKFPEITFHSERIAKTGKGYVMSGPLTIKGHTKNVDMPFTYSVGTANDGKPTLRAEAQTEINRHDFGIDYGSNFSVGKTVKITIHIQATP